MSQDEAGESTPPVQETCPHINQQGHEWESWCMDCGKIWPNNLHTKGTFVAIEREDSHGAGGDHLVRDSGDTSAGDPISAQSVAGRGVVGEAMTADEFHKTYHDNSRSPWRESWLAFAEAYAKHVTEALQRELADAYVAIDKNWVTHQTVIENRERAEAAEAQVAALSQQIENMKK